MSPHAFDTVLLGRTLVGAWIETSPKVGMRFRTTVAPLWVRGLKLLVLVNQGNTRSRTLVGAWIETCRIRIFSSSAFVAPLWVRGLKQDRLETATRSESRTLVGAWIETPHRKQFIVK